MCKAAVVYGKLPYMTSPLGRYWRQPEGLRDRVRVYETHATIDEIDWQALSQYESTLPTGTYSGKTWRCGPYLCWYGRVNGSTIKIGRARALVQGPGTNATYRG